MKVAVYCGSSSGNNPVFEEATKELGQYFAEHDIDVVYGGGKVGLMGVMADAVMAHGGRVYGVIPAHLKHKEIGHDGITELKMVDGMHERKALMAEMADVFVALPGGVGTLEEMFEVWTWAQLGHHNKPCIFYNVANFYDPLMTMVQHMSDTGFVKQQYIDMVGCVSEPEALIEAIKAYQAPEEKWR